jgi:hypothetical protein
VREVTCARVSPSAWPIWLAESRCSVISVSFSTTAVFSHFLGGFFVLRPRRCILPRTWPRVSPNALAIWAVDISRSASLAILRISAADHF